jgi:hypothetical protein
MNRTILRYSGLTFALAGIALGALIPFGLAWHQAAILTLWATGVMVIMLIAIRKHTETTMAQQPRPVRLAAAILIPVLAYLGMVLVGIPADQVLSLVLLIVVLGLASVGIGRLFSILPRVGKIALAGILLVAVALFFVNRVSVCWFIACEPALWSEQLAGAQQVAQQKTSGARLETVIARAAYRATMTTDGVSAMEITFEFVSPTRDLQANGGEALYPLYSITIDDRDPRITHLLGGRSWTSSVPPANMQEALQLVQISPRDVLQRTRSEAEIFFGHPIRPRDFSIILDLADLAQERYNVAAAWSIRYTDGTKAVTIWLDARDGQILDRDSR